MLEGDWNIFSGQYFKEWTPRVHIIEPFYIPKAWTRFIGGDYGFKKPSSVGWYAVRPEGGLVRYREIYKEGLHYDKLAEMICESSQDEDIEYAVFDPAIFGDKQHHKEAREGLSGAEIMQESINEWFEKNGDENNAFGIIRADNRRIEGWRNLKQQIRIDEYGQTNFESFSNCVHFNSTFPANIHDEKKPEDVNTNGEDHTADECRYAIMSRPPETDLTMEKPLSHLSPLYKMKQLQKRRKAYR